VLFGHATPEESSVSDFSYCEDEAVGFSEILERIYQDTRCHIRQERILNTAIVLQGTSVGVNSIHLAPDRELDRWQGGLL
jgi:hypothetical protein